MSLWISWFISVFFILGSHPLHMSFTNIEYNDSIQEWEVSVKLFKDDFADEMKRLYSVDIDIEVGIVDSVQQKSCHSFISDYFDLRINDDVIGVDSWKYQGSKLNFEAIWLNYSFPYNEEPRDIEVKNTLMFSLFRDQKNLLIFTFNDFQKAWQFRHNKPQIHFKVE